jgi:hypothetical protein
MSIAYLFKNQNITKNFPMAGCETHAIIPMGLRTQLTAGNDLYDKFAPKKPYLKPIEATVFAGILAYCVFTACFVISTLVKITCESFRCFVNVKYLLTNKFLCALGTPP